MEAATQVKLAWVIPHLLAACVSAAGLSDVVDLGEGQTTIVGDFVGGHDMRRAARVINDGDEASCELRVAANEPLTIEVEEIDGRGASVRGYQVLVDDKPVYFRTWHEAGAGPVHYFIQFSPPGRDRVKVRFVNRSSASFAIGRVWAWSDFEKFFDDREFAVPYYFAPTIRLSAQREEIREALRTIKQSLRDHPNVKGAWTTSIPYARPNRNTAALMDQALQLSKEFDLPVQICLNSWWGHTPFGPDGKGGRWVDVQYQQVVWNETHKRMQLSIPNRWASVAWLTTNHPDLNAFKVSRLAAATAHLLKASAGKRQHILAINLDNEPIYWANGNAGLGDDLKWADFNPHAVAAAKKDGVTLDPIDGLSREERTWLWKNLLRYNEMIASTVVEALSGEPQSDDPLADNVYTQAMMMAAPDRQFPMVDGAYPLWESAAPASCRVGGEWNADAVPQRQGVEHQLPLGRNASVNAECDDNADEHQGVRMGYALGQRFYAMYNYPLDKLGVAAGDVADLSAAYPAIVYEPTLIEHRFDGPDWSKDVVSHDGIVAKLIGNTTAVAAMPASASKPGYVTYRIDRPASGGLAMELSARANDYRKPNRDVKIRVLAGESEDVATMREVAVLSEIRDLDNVHRIDLSGVGAGSKPVFVRIELHAPDLPPMFMSWCALYRVRFTKPWLDELFEGLPPQDRSLRRVRKESLIISWRRDAELAIARLPQADRSAAQKGYQDGRYADAYKLAARGLRLKTATTRPSIATPISTTQRAMRNIEGVITEVRQLTPYEMPAIALDGKPLVVVDLSAPIHVDGNRLMFRTQPLGSIPLKPGQRVRMRVDSETSRVFELWVE